MKRLIEFFGQAIGKCQFSMEGMKYADSEARIPVSSSGVFFPAASWLRAFFHDAGTYIKSPSQGGPKGEGRRSPQCCSFLQHSCQTNCTLVALTACRGMPMMQVAS
jgi:hypothetical protein